MKRIMKMLVDHIRFLVNHVKIVNVEEFKDKDKEYKTLLSLKYQLFNEDSKDKKSNLTKPIWC